MARIQLDRVSSRPPGRLVPLSLGGMLPGWCAPAAAAVLSDIDLTLKDGDRLAVVGPRGAGKSALLQLLAGRLVATAGTCRVDGTVVDLCEPGRRLDPERTGREHLAGLSGLRAREAAAFSDLGDLLDVPVGHYSPGMRRRLGQALAGGAGEVVLADEVVARADLAFRERARRRLEQLLERARLAVLVEPDLDWLARTCNRGLWLEHGRVRQLGPAGEVLGRYRAAGRIAG